MLLGSNGLRTTLVACSVVLSCSVHRVGTSTSAGGTRVAIDSGNWIVPPCAVDLSDRHSHSLRIALYGYEDHLILMDLEAAGWRLEGILFEEEICLAVSVTSGTVYTLTLEQYATAFRQEAVKRAPARDWLHIIAVVEADKAWSPIAELKSAGVAR